ncbi:hypothetical protein PG994_009021 [Apiospora phragmitis]|uniref:Transcription factor domain-containing protein n=1 Tax=Apiospora phragmitis TaxID=2905665 RepID=A0ABR1UI34_9PEZI
MNSLNPYISQMDPELHTFNYVRQKCPFLFTAMLAAAAKALHPELYPKLHHHVEELFGQNFRLGRKSTEIAQAVLIMTYWKEPDDSRAWISLGYVIRMGIELGWHRLKPSSVDQETTQMTSRNVKCETFNGSGTSSSMSLQTGKSWMIERDAFIESIEPWCKDSMATASDNLLGALVTLRLLSSEVFRLLGPKSSRVGGDQLHSLESLLSIIRVRVEEWERKWLQSVATVCLMMSPVESCHPFLIRFYGTHLRLQLLSLPLQEILASKEPDITSNLEVFWVSYSNAMDMLQLICSSATWLYFAQDSIHVMTAYSAAFLIRLLLSAPEYINGRIEPQVCDAIRATADAFSGQSSPPGSSCWLQARFLARIVMKHMERRHDRDLVLSPSAPASGPTVSNSLFAAGSPSANDATPTRGHSTLHAQDGPLQSYRHPDEPRLDFAFSTDEGVWTDMFTSAGFSFQDGVFFA